uniref:Structural maintenance of chromosomes protein n=1 Tax=Globodera rostochiensis TaxID=31243 RepID=A0A914HXQ1_GLORO
MEGQGFLYSLEIENFKSFKGKHFIGPFKRFSAIIGPNGSGKSNLMDAISFVLGERTHHLRVKRLGDLIHGASISIPESKTCCVRMIYRNPDGSERIFQRTTAEFRVGDSVVNLTQYHKALEEINIFSKARNFLVYQGAVEHIAMQNPKELTQLFEELSKSSECKEDYEMLKEEMHQAEAHAQTNLTKKRDILLELREAKQERNEARRFQTLKEELTAQNRELFLVQLFFAEKNKQLVEDGLDMLRKDLEKKKSDRSNFENELHEKQRTAKDAHREKQRIEMRLQKEERKVLGKRPNVMKSKQQLDHCCLKLDSVRKAYETAKRATDFQEKTVQEAEARIKKAEQEKASLEEELNKESQAMQLNLSKEQVAEYRRLKAEVEKRCTIVSTDLDNKLREQEAANNAIEYDKRRLHHSNARLQQKQAELDRERRNLEALRERESEQLRLLGEERENLKELQNEVTKSKESKRRLEEDLQHVCKEIADAHGDNFDTERNQRQHEAVENLKRVFPEKVYGRLVDLCQPSQKRYQIAVTKVLGKHMMSIVCDNEETGRECIAYLREQHYPPETLLPLTELRMEQIKEHLRDIREPPGVKLVFDVINVPGNAQHVRKALQFVCGNSLVCETPDHARQLAYGTDGRTERFRAVALDGTQFQPNGVISGGGADLKAKAKKWDENTIRKLKDRRSVLQEDLQKLHRTGKRELDVEMKRNQIHSLEARLRFAQQELKKGENETLRRLEQDVEVETAEPETIESRIENRQIEIEERKVEIERLEQKKNAFADDIFAQFCAKIGINHIREYEQREMRIHEEHEQRLNQYNHELERLRYELEYLKSEDKKASVEKEQQKLKGLEKDKKRLEGEYKSEQKELKELERSVEALKSEVEAKKEECSKADQNVSAEKKQMNELDKELHSIERALAQKQQERNQKAQKRHSLLHQCKLQSIDIPLLSGSLDQIMLDAEMTNSNTVDDSQPGTSSQSHYETTQSQTQSLEAAEEIEIDYSDVKIETKKLESEVEISKLIEQLSKTTKTTEESLSKMQMPSAKVDERMDQVKEKETENQAELEHGRKEALKARKAFERTKADRLRRFQEFFEPVAQRIDEIYKLLSQNESAQAFLGPINMEEPYLDGISYNCIAPGKRFRPMDNLSGGEKTVAALALLFAIHSSNPSPFFVLDEIDAALDNTNIGKVVHYIGERSRTDIQLIVISLKEEMYNKADALIGVFPRSTQPCIASGILTYDLENFSHQMFEEQ